MIDRRHRFRTAPGVAVLIATVFALMALAGCGDGTEQSNDTAYQAPPTPPPFRNDTLRIGAGDSRSMSYSVSSGQLSQGRWCLEYEVDLTQESSRNNLDLDSFISLPTGETIRQVTIDALNSPIRGKVYAEQAGRYSIVLDNESSLFTSKTVALKTRMYTPC